MTKAMIVVFGLLTAGAAWAGYYGVGGETASIARSIRGGGPGGIGYIGGVK